MAVQLRRPILVGGIALSFGLWVLQGLHHSVTQLSELGVLAAMAVGLGMWLWQPRRSAHAVVPAKNLPLTRAIVETAIAQTEGVISQLAAEAEHHAANATLQQRVAQLKLEMNRQHLNLTVTGGKGVGKTILIEVLSNSELLRQSSLCWQETPALFTGVDVLKHWEADALATALASDLVLFVTNSDLTDSEFQTLQQLVTANQRLLLVFNKQDQYLPQERTVVLDSLQQRMRLLSDNQERETYLVVGTVAAPGMVKVRQHQSDGTIREWQEQPEPQTGQLAELLAQIQQEEGQQLVWATTKRLAATLKAEAKVALNEVRRERALPIVEQYQWIAAAAAFANPVPALDLLATAAVNAQLVMELGAVYQQKFSLAQAQAVAGTLGSLMLKLGLVELSTQAISGVLKSNAITFVAGGVLQGVSAAYLTRVAGISLIEYFQEQEASTENSLNLNRLRQTLQRVFQQNQQLTFLQSFASNLSRKLAISGADAVGNSSMA